MLVKYWNRLCNENYNYLKYLGVRWDYVAVFPDWQSPLVELRVCDWLCVDKKGDQYYNYGGLGLGIWWMWDRPHWIPNREACICSIVTVKDYFLWLVKKVSREHILYICENNQNIVCFCFCFCLLGFQLTHVSRLINFLIIKYKIYFWRWNLIC